MNLYALLIGINEYPVRPLNFCVQDVAKIENYLNTLSDHFDKIKITTLLDKQADKKSVVEAIPAVLGQATNDDVALLYYSGHGALEKTGGRFPTEHDGALECMVCYFESRSSSNFFLADKEIRYLLSNLRNSPHLVTLFDCCHSGDMVRNNIDLDNDDMVKRMSGHFDARPYSQFIFSQAIKANQLKAEGLPDAIKFKNHIHIAACSPSQSSWENKNGGVFTRYLLALLHANNNQITYQEITRWAKVSIKGMTKKQQTPTFSVQGKGNVNALSNWLNLPKGDGTENGRIAYNAKAGWCYTRGALMGVQSGMNLDVLLGDGRQFTAKIKEVETEIAIIEDPLELGFELDLQKQYEAISDTVYSPLSVFLNDLDQNTTIEKEIKEILEAYPNLQIANDRGGANYLVNIFNQQVYLSLGDWEFRPLAKQIDLLNTQNDLIKSQINDQLSYLIKWHHCLTLENPDKGFDIPPIKIEIKVLKTKQWVDVTATEFDLMPKDNRDGEEQLYNEFKLRITNTTNEKLYVGVLSLFSDFEIETSPFDDKTIELEPNITVELYNHFTKADKDKTENKDGNELYISLESYMEVYNWPWEFWNFVFIVNNFEDFTPSLIDFIQPAQENPLILHPETREIVQPRGGGPSRALKTKEKKWGTVKTTIRLKNTNYNIISGDLQKLWKYYTENELLAPYIGELYLEARERGLYRDSYSKANVKGEGENEKNIGGTVKKIMGNKLDNYRRWRIFKNVRKRMQDKPLIVAEGDSWFLYPFLVKDIIDYVMEEFPVRSLAAAGDELGNYKKDGQLLAEVDQIQPKYVLISGGGNDIIGEEIQHILIENVPKGQKAEAYLNDEFKRRMEELEKLFLYFFEALKKVNSVKQVFVHGYDYVLASNDVEILENGWVNRYMKEKGIDELEDRQKIINHLLNTFNNMLERICEKEAGATYLNVLNKTAADEWYDEIHPNDQGFKKIGQRFINAIYEFEKQI